MMGVPISELVDVVYSTYHDGERWKDFCKLLSTQHEHAYVAMHGHEVLSGRTLGFLNTNYSEHHLSQYKAYYGAQNPWAKGYVAVPEGSVQTSESIVQYSDLVRTEWYNDWIRPQEDIATGAGVTIYKSRDAVFRLSCNIRLKDKERHQAELVETLRQLTPHLRQAISIARRFHDTPLSEGAESALNLHPSLIWLLDHVGRIVFANSAALSFQKSDPGIVSSHGALTFSDLLANSTIARCLRNMGGGIKSGQNRSIQFLIKSSSEEMRATLTPFNSSGRQTFGFLDVPLGDAPLAMLVVDRPRQKNQAIEDKLKRLYQLTSAELEIALLLADGNSLDHIAQRRGSAKATVRSQLKSLFGKTGVRKQHELVAAIHGTIAD